MEYVRFRFGDARRKRSAHQQKRNLQNQPRVEGETEKSTGKTERNIFATEDDPLYQSFRQNFSAYRCDISDGEVV